MVETWSLRGTGRCIPAIVVETDRWFDGDALNSAPTLKHSMDCGTLDERRKLDHSCLTRVSS